MLQSLNSFRLNVLSLEKFRFLKLIKLVSGFKKLMKLLKILPSVIYEQNS